MVAQNKRIAFILVFILLTGWSIFAAGSTFYGKWLDLHSDKVYRFGVNTWEGRISPLLRYLPQRGIVGYLSEKDLPSAPVDTEEDLEEMLMTQFFLVPRIIVPGAGQAWVIGNFGTADVDLGVIESEYGLLLRQTFSYGIYLFESTSP